MTGFIYERRIEFADTDMAGIAHFSAFFRYMEEAEHAFLRSIGLDVYISWDGDVVSWPRVSAKCDYRSPARFGETLTIAVQVSELGTKSVTYSFDVSSANRPIAAGQFVTVCCRIRDAHPPVAQSIEPILIPAPIRAKLEPRS